MRTQPGDVAHLDARTGALLCNTAVGVDPSEILVAPDGRRGYVSVRGENKVKELDLRRSCPRLTGREAVVGTQPDTLQLTPDRHTLVVTLRGTPAQISLLDTAASPSLPVSIPGHTTTGHHWLSRDGRLSFVAVENPAGVAVVDNRSGQRRGRLPVSESARRQPGARRVLLAARALVAAVRQARPRACRWLGGGFRWSRLRGDQASTATAGCIRSRMRSATDGVRRWARMPAARARMCAST